MRQVVVQSTGGGGERVLAKAREHGAVNLVCFTGRDAAGESVDSVTVHLPNDRVGAFIDALDPASARIAVHPSGVLTLRPPEEEVAEQAKDVTNRSALEIYLDGIQAIGSWTGFLGYAVSAGVVAWLGFYTGSMFLLVGAMLIAPFAGPAMNVALATARGDGTLLSNALARYVGGLSATAVTAAALTALFGQSEPTDLMIAVVSLSAAAFLLPVAAGLAGALHLSQSERSSLVSGAGAGMLVSASLAPPAALIGMGAVLNEWGIVRAGAFLIALQLAGINLSGALAFRAFGVRTEGPRYPRGRRQVAWAALAATVLAIGGLLYGQFASPGTVLQREQVVAEAREIASEVIRADGAVSLVELEARFPRTAPSAVDVVLVTGHVHRFGADAAETNDAVRARLSASVREALSRELAGITPLVDLTVFPALPADAR